MYFVFYAFSRSKVYSCALFECTVQEWTEANPVSTKPIRCKTNIKIHKVEGGKFSLDKRGRSASKGVENSEQRSDKFIHARRKDNFSKNIDKFGGAKCWRKEKENYDISNSSSISNLNSTPTKHKPDNSLSIRTLICIFDNTKVAKLSQGGEGVVTSLAKQRKCGQSGGGH